MNGVAGVPVAPVYNFEQAFNDPQVIERGMKVRARHGSGNDMDMIASPIKLSDTPITEYKAPPQLGQHTNEVLKEVLDWMRRPSPRCGPGRRFEAPPAGTPAMRRCVRQAEGLPEEAHG